MSLLAAAALLLATNPATEVRLKDPGGPVMRATSKEPRLKGIGAGWQEFPKGK